MVYVLIAFMQRGRFARRARRRASPAILLAQLALRRIKRLVARSAAFNAVLAEALGRFVAEWSEAARPLLIARAVRLFHLCAAAVGIGLIAGLYLRGIALDYRAGWESTFLDARQVRALIAVLYGPASALTGIAIPDADHLAALRWEGGRRRRERGALDPSARSHRPAVHRAAAPAACARRTVSLWRRSRNAPLPPALVPYFRSAFASVHGMAGVASSR